jgi:uncharacterized protein YggT (Ycf19 family)
MLTLVPQIVLVILFALQILVLLRVFIDMLPMKGNNQLFVFIFEASEPLLKPLRHHVRIVKFGWVDFSVFYFFLIVSLIEWGLFRVFQ